MFKISNPAVLEKAVGESSLVAQERALQKSLSKPIKVIRYAGYFLAAAIIVRSIYYGLNSREIGVSKSEKVLEKLLTYTVFSPGTAHAATKLGRIYRDPRGLFVGTTKQQQEKYVQILRQSKRWRQKIKLMRDIVESNKIFNRNPKKFVRTVVKNMKKLKQKLRK